MGVLNIGNRAMENTPSSEKPTNPKLKLRWHQFSLRSLLIFVALFAIACSCFAVKMKAARKQRAEVEKIKKRGCLVAYSCECDDDGKLANGCYNISYHDAEEFDDRASVPKWLRKQLGDDFFYEVVRVDVWNGNGLGLNDMEGIKALQKTELGKRVKMIRFTTWNWDPMTDKQIEDKIHESFPQCKVKVGRAVE
jgi:hypothetical protein